MGSVCWGHVTGVIESNTRTFATNWTGTGTIENAGDDERLALETGEYMTSEIVNTGAQTVELDQNHYKAGDNVKIEYRTASTYSGIDPEAWVEYTVPFKSLGFVHIRVTSTL